MNKQIQFLALTCSNPLFHKAQKSTYFLLRHFWSVKAHLLNSASKSKAWPRNWRAKYNFQMTFAPSVTQLKSQLSRADQHFSSNVVTGSVSSAHRKVSSFTSSRPSSKSWVVWLDASRRPLKSKFKRCLTTSLKSSNDLKGLKRNSNMKMIHWFVFVLDKGAMALWRQHRWIRGN